MDDNDDGQSWPPKPEYNAQHDNKASLPKRQLAGLSFLLGLVFYVGFWFLAYFWDYVYGSHLLTLNQAVGFAWSAVFSPDLLLLMHKILRSRGRTIAAAFSASLLAQLEQCFSIFNCRKVKFYRSCCGQSQDLIGYNGVHPCLLNSMSRILR